MLINLIFQDKKQVFQYKPCFEIPRINNFKIVGISHLIFEILNTFLEIPSSSTKVLNLRFLVDIMCHLYYVLL